MPYSIPIEVIGSSSRRSSTSSLATSYYTHQTIPEEEIKARQQITPFKKPQQK
jgi:hypothetical protein